MARPSNWPDKLRLFLADKESKPFEWGTNDCCLFACDWISILTGIDPSVQLQIRGSYDSALSAARILEQHEGLESICEKSALENKWDEVALAYARRGDLMILQTDAGVAAGVCDGARSFFVGDIGFYPAMTLKCKRAWRL